jgi:hypothetical protein
MTSRESRGSDRATRHADGAVCKPMQEWTSGIVVVPAPGNARATKAPGNARATDAPGNARATDAPRRRRLVAVAALLTAIAAGMIFEHAGPGSVRPVLDDQAMVTVRGVVAAAASLIEPILSSAVLDKPALAPTAGAEESGQLRP